MTASKIKLIVEMTKKLPLSCSSKKTIRLMLAIIRDMSDKIRLGQKLKYKSIKLNMCLTISFQRLCPKFLSMGRSCIMMPINIS